MDELNTTILNLPRRPDPRDDVDDLIFRAESWLASDRYWAVSYAGDGLFVPFLRESQVFLYFSFRVIYNNWA